jgi:phosphohistidine phosphatase SixA
MKRTLPHLFVALLAIACSESGSRAAATAPAALGGEALMHALQSGGYTILLRHARTDRNAPNQETPGTVPTLRSEQRNLTAEGEADVRSMRDVVRRFAFPISEVISSPSYRCRETADAFGPADVTMTLRAFPTTAETQALVAATPKPGTNRVLVTHHFVIENHVPGIAPGDVGESEAAVVRPTGDGRVELVGKIKLADWQQLGGAPAHGAPPAAAVQPGGGGAAASHHPPGGGAAATAPPALDLPATPLGRLAAAYVEAFNSGDGGRMGGFIDSAFVESSDRPTAVRVAAYLQLFADHGALTVTGVQSETASALALRARSKRGNLTLTVTPSASQPGRIQSLTFAFEGGGGH